MEEKLKEDIAGQSTSAAQDVATAETAATDKPRKAGMPRWMKWALAVVVLAVIACMGVKPAYLNYKSGQLISQNFAPWTPGDFDDDEVDGNDAVMSELSELFANVGSGKDIKLTVYRLEKALKLADSDYYYYLYADDIAWYLALAYIQQNQFGSARAMLKRIMADGDSDYADEAEALYKQIENMLFM